MQNTFSQSGNDSKWFLKKSFFRISMWNSRPPPLHGKNHLKFPFWLFATFLYTRSRNNTNNVLVWFSVMRFPKVLLPPVKIRIFGPKKGQTWPKICFFWSFRAKYWPFWSIWCPARPKKQSERGAYEVFWYVGTRTFAPSQCLASKRPFLPKKMFLGCI